MAYGYKPADLVHMRAIDVVDFFKGLRRRLKEERKMMFDAAEMAGLLATGKYRRSRADLDRSEYSDKIKEMIAEQDRIDIEKGLIDG